MQGTKRAREKESNEALEQGARDKEAKADGRKGLRQQGNNGAREQGRKGGKEKGNQ